MMKSASHHLDERYAERSPHERVDDGVDTRVEVGDRLECVENQQRVIAIAVHHHEAIQLTRQPRHGKRRRNNQTHLGHFASGLLLGR